MTRRFVSNVPFSEPIDKEKFAKVIEASLTRAFHT